MTDIIWRDRVPEILDPDACDEGRYLGSIVWSRQAYCWVGCRGHEAERARLKAVGRVEQVNQGQSMRSTPLR